MAECVAYAFALWFHNNMGVYAIYSFLELFLVCVYFNHSVPFLHRRHIGLWIGAGSVLIGIFNTIFLQPLSTFNSHFLYYEAILTIGLVLFAFTRIMIEGANEVLVRNPHFWIGIAFAFFWSITFCNWALYQYYYATDPALGSVVNISIDVANTLTYAVVSIVFLKYPSWKHSA